MNEYVTRRLGEEPKFFSFSISISILLMYGIGVAVAELSALQLGLLPSIVCHALLILVLLNHYARVRHAVYRRTLLVIALIPLLRILSVTMPLRDVPRIYWYALIGVPLLVATLLVMRRIGLSWAAVGLRWRSWPMQLLIALSGVPLGFEAFFILRPRPLVPVFNWPEMLVGAIMVVLFSAFCEELLFRGMLQKVAVDVMGQLGVLYSSALFAFMYVSWLPFSLAYILFVTSTGLFFSWCVVRTKSLWGVILAHSILNILALLILPLL